MRSARLRKRRRGHQIGDLEDTEQLVDPGRGEIHQLAGAPPRANRRTTGAEGLGDLIERGLQTGSPRRRAPPRRRARADAGSSARRETAAARSPTDALNASLSECAGSIDSNSTVRDGVARARRTAVAAATVVLPTPPFPPNSRSEAPRNAATSSGEIV